MSTNQPPGGQQPEGTPAYAQPQDPWAGGYDPGHVSVPTDPIPQQYDPYAQGAQGEVWSQPTVAQGGPYGYVPQQPQKSKAGVIILIFLVVLLLGGGGGFGAWYILKGPGSVNPTTTPTTTTPAAVITCPVSAAAGAFDPCSVKQGDCLFNNGTAADPDLKIVECSTAKSYKVIKVSKGAAILEGPGDRFDKDTTSVKECAGTNYDTWYGYQDATDDKKDVFLCMTNNT